MDRAERFVHGRGAWMAFFAFIPIWEVPYPLY